MRMERPLPKVSFASVLDAMAAMPTTQPLNERPAETTVASPGPTDELNPAAFGAQQFNVTWDSSSTKPNQRG